MLGVSTAETEQIAIVWQLSKVLLIPPCEPNTRRRYSCREQQRRGRDEISRKVKNLKPLHLVLLVMEVDLDVLADHYRPKASGVDTFAPFTILRREYLD